MAFLMLLPLSSYVSYIYLTYKCAIYASDLNLFIMKCEWHYMYLFSRYSIHVLLCVMVFFWGIQNDPRLKRIHIEASVYMYL